MADFVAVLKKALDKYGEPALDVRTRTYDGARAALVKKLADFSPPLSADVIAKQKRSLEDAITSVERDYAKPAPASDPLAELEHIFSSIDRNKNQPSHVKPSTTPASAPAPAWQPAKPVQPAPVARAEPSWQRPAPTPPPPAARAETVNEQAAELDADDDSADVFANDEQPAADTFQRLRPAERQRSYGGLIAAVAALLVVAGGGYGIWLNKDAFSSMFGLGDTKTVSTEPLVKPVPAKPAAEAPAPAAAGEGTKFTQRLTPEGGETDPGPAAGQSGIGEGESVAALTTPPPPAPAPAATPAPATPPPSDAAATAVPATPAPATPAPDASATPQAIPPAEGAAPPANGAAPADAAATPPAPAAGTPPAAPTTAAPEPTVAVGQKAIFYEERTSTSQGSAEPGSIVWSLVQESPGGDAPPEPAIRAEATIPGKDIQLRMTIRRNTDQTLPASHIIEMIFLTPQGFDGGGVDNILRVAMKSSEQDAGSPLIGIPAKIADGFFLVALNDTKADEDANLTLLRGQDWIDVPVVYKTGRRALLTMEKGIPGEKVFDEALKAWQAKTAG
ncbi:hypothetical protein [Mesorhizobium sp. 128a]